MGVINKSKNMIGKLFRCILTLAMSENKFVHKNVSKLRDRYRIGKKIA